MSAPDKALSELIERCPAGSPRLRLRTVALAIGAFADGWPQTIVESSARVANIRGLINRRPDAGDPERSAALVLVGLGREQGLDLVAMCDGGEL